MTHHVPQIASIKNHWLYQQVDVEFPTKESLKGRELYQNSADQRDYVELNAFLEKDETNGIFSKDEIYLVDFHRLTVLFSLLQAKRWSEEADQQMIVEFLTQIIYSEPCQLFIGFSKGEPVAAAIVTNADNQLLVSDVVVADDAMHKPFVRALMSKDETRQLFASNSDAYLEI